jgi:hypothetical protein
MEMSQWNSLYSYLTQTKMSFSKNKEQKGKIGPIWVLAPVGIGGRCGERVCVSEYGRIMYSCMKMENWDLLKLFQAQGEGG